MAPSAHSRRGPERPAPLTFFRVLNFEYSLFSRQALNQENEDAFDEEDSHSVNILDLILENLACKVSVCNEPGKLWDPAHPHETLLSPSEGQALNSNPGDFILYFKSCLAVKGRWDSNPAAGSYRVEAFQGLRGGSRGMV